MQYSEDLLIPKSCVKTGNPHLTPARWGDCNMVKWDNEGAIKPVGGWTKVLNVQQKIDDAAREAAAAAARALRLRMNTNTHCENCGAKL